MAKLPRRLDATTKELSERMRVQDVAIANLTRCENWSINDPKNVVLKVIAIPPIQHPQNDPSPIFPHTTSR